MCKYILLRRLTFKSQIMSNTYNATEKQVMKYNSCQREDQKANSSHIAADEVAKPLTEYFRAMSKPAEADKGISFFKS